MQANLEAASAPSCCGSLQRSTFPSAAGKKGCHPKVSIPPSGFELLPLKHGLSTQCYVSYDFPAWVIKLLNS